MSEYLASLSLPEGMSAEGEYKELLIQAKAILKRLKKEVAQTEKAWENSAAISTFYHKTSMDVLSLKKDKVAIGARLATCAEQLAESLKVMEDPGVAELSDKLIECTNKANQLNDSFAEINELLISLDSDLVGKNTTADLAYKNLVIELKKQDEDRLAANKDSKEKQPISLVKQLEDFKPLETNNKINGEASNQSDKSKSKEPKKGDKPSEGAQSGGVKGDFKKFYDNLITLSIGYQNELVPLMDRLAGLQPKLLAANEALATDLTSNRDELLAKEATAAAALQSKKNEIQVHNILIKSLHELETIQRKLGVSVAGTEAGGTGNGTNPENPKKGVAPTPPEDKISIQLGEAKAQLKLLETEKTNFENYLTSIEAEINNQQTVNSSIEAQTALLDKTNKLSGEMEVLISSLGETTASLSTKLDTLEMDFAGDGRQNSLLVTFTESLKTLSEEEAEITALNDAISQSAEEGDIKVYFGKLAANLANFPETAKTIVSNALFINRALRTLMQWSTQLNEEVVGDVKTHFEESSYQLTGDTGANAKRSNKIKSNLETELVSDTELLKTNKQPFDTEAWGTDFKANKDIVGNAGRPSTLAGWKDYFEKRSNQVDEQKADQEKKEEFLNKLKETGVAV